MPISREKARKNISRISGLKGVSLEKAVDKFMARQKNRTRKRKR